MWGRRLRVSFMATLDLGLLKLVNRGFEGLPLPSCDFFGALVATFEPLMLYLGLRNPEKEHSNI